jgi:CBS domain containing-hemolysin-like protein
MTNIDQVSYTLEMDVVLTKDLLRRIKKNGYSRVPIIENNDLNRIIGVLLAKSCLGVDLN